MRRTIGPPINLVGFTFWRVCDKSKEICEEWLKWCLDERTNGEVTGFSNQKELDGFQEVRHDQSILTNLLFVMDSQS